ncbi:MAG: aminoacetone oxidase family FAD-binding enzyme [Lachnospiraceae bacterium]|nr:aminoacetone oxidase family FAD-binding enzyme [Lachnospiraceae bacterium]
MRVLVIGGGASGMVAALNANKGGHSVTVLESSERIGQKILQTGNGKCNLTNADLSLKHYHGLRDEEASRALVASVFGRFSREDVLAFFQELGLETKTRDGYYYPASEQASAVLSILLSALEHAGVSVVCGVTITGIRQENHVFTVQTPDHIYEAERVILCCGSRAGRKENLSDGYELAKSLSHTVVDPLPALVKIKSDEKIFRALAGIRVGGRVTLYDENNLALGSDTGEIQLSAYGLSGIPTMQVSHLASAALHNRKKISAELDLLPDLTIEACQEMLSKRKERLSYQKAETFLIGLFHKNLGITLIKQAGIPLQAAVASIGNDQIETLARLIKHWRLPVVATGTFQDAQVCAGGVPVAEVKDTLESRLTDGLYFAGEILDVHGDCGGYNLQWAFSSGLLAGSLE